MSEREKRETERDRKREIGQEIWKERCTKRDGEIWKELDMLKRG